MRKKIKLTVIASRIIFELWCTMLNTIKMHFLFSIVNLLIFWNFKSSTYSKALNNNYSTELYVKYQHKFVRNIYCTMIQYLNYLYKYINIYFIQYIQLFRYGTIHFIGSIQN